MTKKLYHMPDHETIACLGDSITVGFWDEEGQGYVSRLSQKIAAQFPVKYGVYNAGVSGDTIVNAWHNFTSRVMHVRPQVLITTIGVNDVCITEGVQPESHKIPHLDRMTTWTNLLDLAVKTGLKILVVGPLPVEEDIVSFPPHADSLPGMTGMRWENADIKKYNDAIEALTTKKNIPFLRLFETWHAKLPEGLFLDGLHPNAKGHELLAGQIFEKLKSLKYIG